MKKIYFLISVFAISLFSTNVLSAQTENQTTMSLLNLAPDARTMSMAGVSTTNATAYSIWNNTAVAALSEQKLSVGISYGMWSPTAFSTNLISAAGYGKLSKMFTLTAGVRTFIDKTQNQTDNTGAILGQFTPYDLQASVGLGIRVLPILSFGVNVNYINSGRGTYSANAFSADVTALVDLKFMYVTAGGYNLGTKIQYAPEASAYNLPANVKVGVGTVQDINDKHQISVGAEAGYLLYTGNFFANVGAEYFLGNFFRVAAGYHYGDVSLYSMPSYVSVGVGANLKWLGIDVAYLIGTSEKSPITNTFNVTVSFQL